MSTSVNISEHEITWVNVGKQAQAKSGKHG